MRILHSQMNVIWYELQHVTMILCLDLIELIVS